MKWKDYILEMKYEKKIGNKILHKKQNTGRATFDSPKASELSQLAHSMNSLLLSNFVMIWL